MLIQVMVVLTALLMGIMATMTQLKTDQTEQDFVMSRSRVLEIRDHILGTIGNQYAWRNTAASNASMACLTTYNCGSQSGGDIIVLKDASGAVVFDGTSPTAGLTLAGETCNTFATTGGGTCVIRPQITWRAQCTGLPGSPNCEIPEEIVDVSFVFNHERLRNINPKRSNFNVTRGSVNSDAAAIRCSARHKFYVGHAVPVVLGFYPDAAGCIPIRAFTGPPGPQGFQGYDGGVGPQGDTGPMGWAWNAGAQPPNPPRPVYNPGPPCIFNCGDQGGTVNYPGARACTAGAAQPGSSCTLPSHYRGVLVCNGAGTAYDTCQATTSCEYGYYLSGGLCCAADEIASGGVCVTNPMPTPSPTPVSCAASSGIIERKSPGPKDINTCNVTYTAGSEGNTISGTVTSTVGGPNGTISGTCNRVAQPSAADPNYAIGVWDWNAVCPNLPTSTCEAGGQFVSSTGGKSCRFDWPIRNYNPGNPNDPASEFLIGPDASGSYARGDCGVNGWEFKFLCKDSAAVVVCPSEGRTVTGPSGVCYFAITSAPQGTSSTVTPQSYGNTNGSWTATCQPTGQWAGSPTCN